MTAITDIFGGQHTIKICTFNDVPGHMSKIKHYIAKDELTEFRLRMNECVRTNTAFALSDDSCFLYYKNKDKYTAVGIALYGKNEPTKMLALFAGIFEKIDKITFKLNFKLHEGKFIEEYKSILTMGSIKRNKKDGSYLVIRIDKLKSKIKQIYAKRKLQ